MEFSHHAELYIVPDCTETPFDMEALQLVSEVTLFQADTFSIGEVRTLIDAAYARPFEKATRTIIIRANAIGLEAQNALLKVLEEPPVTTRFILLLRQGSVILPTLLSRVQLVTNVSTTLISNGVTFEVFLHTSIAERMAQIATSTKNKDVETLNSLYVGLAAWLAQPSVLTVVQRSRLLWCESMLTVHGASKKMLWEEIALSLPVAKQ